MGRSPSPSRRRRDRERGERKKRRERVRERSRERDKDRETRRIRSRERERDRSRSRERDRSRRRSRSHSRDRGHPSTSRGTKPDRPEISEADLEGKSPEEIEMMKTMGFCNFDTTKNKKVDGNDVGEVHVILKRKYRQYMNRKGGFNRPLDFVA